MISTNHVITTTASKLVSASTSKRTVYIHVLGNNVVYLGGSNVTSSNGMLTEKTGAPQPIVVPAHEELWAVSANTENLRLLMPSKNDGS